MQFAPLVPTEHPWSIPGPLPASCSSSPHAVFFSQRVELGNMQHRALVPYRVTRDHTRAKPAAVTLPAAPQHSLPGR